MTIFLIPVSTIRSTGRIRRLPLTLFPVLIKHFDCSDWDPSRFNDNLSSEKIALPQIPCAVLV